MPTTPADLAAVGHDVQAFEAECHRVGKHLAAVSAARSEALAQQFKLPPAGVSLKAEQASYRLPAGVISSLPHPSAKGGGLEGARARAEENLGSLPLLEADASFQSMLAWLKLPDWAEQQAVDGVTAMLQLHSVEREMFRRWGWLYLCLSLCWVCLSTHHESCDVLAYHTCNSTLIINCPFAFLINMQGCCTV